VCSTLDRENDIGEYFEVEFLPKSLGNLITPIPLGYHPADLLLIEFFEEIAFQND
jgi:hypothetical protein